MNPPDDLAGLSDEQLVERCRSAKRDRASRDDKVWDDAAWSELRGRFQQLVRWKVAGLTVPHGWMDFDDYISLVWIRLLEQIEHYDPSRGRFRSFLMVLTHNLVLDQLRSQRQETFHTRRLSTGTPRSEEHTSELQSLRDLVCRLLLEKKKTQTRETQPTPQLPKTPAKSSLRLCD